MNYSCRNIIKLEEYPCIVEASGWLASKKSLQPTLILIGYQGRLRRDTEASDLWFSAVASHDSSIFNDMYSTSMLGFALYSTMKRSSDRRQSTASIKQWQNRVKISHQSEMMQVAQVLLAEVTSLLTPDWEDDGMELRTRAAVGFAKASCNFTDSAKALLESCASEILKLNASKAWWVTWEYTVFAELVKCCNILKLEQSGEKWAELALLGPSELASCSEVQYVQIALADSFIGQQRYGDAQQLLSRMSQESCLSDYLAVVTFLRLNKVRRRLDDQDALLSDRSITTWNGAFKSAGASKTLKLELIEELVSTAFQSDHSALLRAQKLVTIAVNSIVDDPDMQKTRQFQLLKRQEKELELRQTAWSSKQVHEENLGTQGPSFAKLFTGKDETAASASTIRQSSTYSTARDDDVVVKTEARFETEAPFERILSAANSAIAEDQKPQREDEASVHFTSANDGRRLTERPRELRRYEKGSRPRSKYTRVNVLL